MKLSFKEKSQQATHGNQYPDINGKKTENNELITANNYKSSNLRKK